MIVPPTWIRETGGAPEGRPLRIAMVTTFYPPYSFGGDGFYVQRLSRALARRGHAVEILTDPEAYEFLSGRKGLEPQEEPEGVKVHFLRSGLGRLSCLATQQLGYPVFNRRRIERILGDRFDVIHFHNVSLLGGPGVLGCGRALKLYTTHEHWLVCQSHILWRHNREICDRRECIRCALAHGRPPQAWRATKLLERQCRHIDAFIALSQSCAENHRRFGFRVPMRVMDSFLPDETPAEQKDVGAASGRPYFLFVGRLSRIKGLQDVIPLFDENSPADLLVAGDGEDGDALRRSAQGRSTVRFLGRQSPEALASLYRGAAAVIVPSRCYEVAPLVVLEAFRAGTPVIARELGPLPELVQRGGGMLFTDSDSLRRCMTRTLREPGLREAMGRAAMRAFHQSWREDVAIRQYLDLIHELFEQRRLLVDNAGSPATVPSKHDQEPMTI